MLGFIYRDDLIMRNMCKQLVNLQPVKTSVGLNVGTA